MMYLKIISFSIALLLSACGKSQENIKYSLVGGPCEGCEAVMEFKEEPDAVDTLPEFGTAENKLKLTGTIYKSDGNTPAEGVVLYIHHTNAGGIYPVKGNEEGWARRHGYLRGWIKTGKDGRYTFYTQVPGSYPERNTPKHIHPLILEPEGNYYYLDEILFENDPLLGSEPLSGKPRGGGDRVLKLQNKDGMATATRDFILGKNVPGYADKKEE